MHIEWQGDTLWTHCLIASTLHHLEVLTKALSRCSRYSVRSLATSVLSGGRRNDPALALGAMRSVLETHAISKTGFDRQVYVLDAAIFQSLRKVARSSSERAPNVA